MSAKSITLRELNRATLARQMLLERSDIGIIEAIEFLGGLQAQTSNAPYHALWTRLQGFTHAAMTKFILDKQLVRVATLRATLHLHSARDALAIRPLVQPVLERGWAGAYKKLFGAANKAKVKAAGIALLRAQPMTNGALAKALAPDFPQSDPHSLAQYLHASEVLVQTPPTRLWNAGHAPLLTRIEDYLPGQKAEKLYRRDLVLRYLAAYGPASVQDMQAWCGLTLLAQDFAALKDRLIVLTDEDGRELFDLPDAPRPDADTPAPVRFMPEYDNAFLGYDNRRRVVSDDNRQLMFTINRYYPPVLIDGMIEGGWRLTQAKGVANLAIGTYGPVTRKAKQEIEKEGDRFARFCCEDAKAIEVSVGEV
jgi:hypothetical protein